MKRGKKAKAMIIILPHVKHECKQGSSPLIVYVYVTLIAWMTLIALRRRVLAVKVAIG